MSKPNVVIDFAEEEARLLSNIVLTTLPYLSDEQAEITKRIADKFVTAGYESSQRLIREVGAKRAEEIAQALLAEHPEADEPIALPKGADQ